MGNRKRESAPVIRFHTDDTAVTITFSEEESAGVRAVILDIPMQKKACHEFADRQEGWTILKGFSEKGKMPRL